MQLASNREKLLSERRITVKEPAVANLHPDHSTAHKQHMIKLQIIKHLRRVCSEYSHFSQKVTLCKLSWNTTRIQNLPGVDALWILAV